MAPSQSYMDSAISAFDLDLHHAPEWKPDFYYHGRNTYTPLLAKYGNTTMPNGKIVIYSLFNIIIIRYQPLI